MKRLLMVLAALAVLTGCTTIPTSSSPVVVRSVSKAVGSQTPAPDTGPEPGADPKAIVEAFQNSELVADGGHSQSRQFLTSAASRKWQDDTAVILDEVSVRDPSITGDTASVTVSGRRVGVLDSSGAFSPTLKGTGTGDEESFSYTLERRDGQWRIDSLPPGILISSNDFRDDFHLLKVYFFDSSNAVLIPDLRYSSLGGIGLATWLMQQLVDGPRTELLQSTANNVPGQIKPTVTAGDSLTVDIPGAAQLSDDERNALAAQVAFTLGQVQFTEGDFRLTDGGRPVVVPAAGGPTFTAAEFATDVPDNQPGSDQFYFLRDGELINGVSGAVISTASRYTSVAVQQVSAQDSRSLAAITESGRLVVGQLPKLTEVKLPAAATSRPEWGPSDDDVWLGVGSTILRVAKGQTPTAVTVTTPTGGPPTGTVTAIRFSPDGIRVALVIRPAKGPGTLWIGSVVTAGSDIRLDSLEPITPPALSVTDVAWVDQSKLAIISAAPGGLPVVATLRSDGSQFSNEANLPGSASPTTVTASPGQTPIVSANGQLYEQILSNWANLGGKGVQSGTAPIYSS